MARRRLRSRRDFDDDGFGFERILRIFAERGALGRRRGHLALVLYAAWPDPRRRRDRVRRWRRGSLPRRLDLARDGLAGAAAAVLAGAGRQRLHRGICHPDDRGARGDAGVDLAEPQLSARGLRQARRRLADHPPRHQRDPQRIRGPRGVAGGMAGRGAQHHRAAGVGHRRAGFGGDRARRPAADAAAADQARRAARDSAMARQHRQQVSRNAASRNRRI